MTDITFITLSGTSRERWKVSAGIDLEYEVYIPYFMFSGNEMSAFFCACSDSIQIAELDGHYFFPSSWVIRELVKSPKEKKEIEKLVDDILRRHEETPL